MTAADYTAAVSALAADSSTCAWAWIVLYSADEGYTGRDREPCAIEGRIIGGGGATNVRIKPARGALTGMWTTTIASPHGNKPVGPVVYVAAAAIAMARDAMPMRLRAARDALARAQDAYDNLAADASKVSA